MCGSCDCSPCMYTGLYSSRDMAEKEAARWLKEGKMTLEQAAVCREQYDKNKQRVEDCKIIRYYVKRDSTYKIYKETTQKMPIGKAVKDVDECARLSNKNEANEICERYNKSEKMRRKQLMEIYKT